MLVPFINAPLRPLHAAITCLPLLHGGGCGQPIDYVYCLHGCDALPRVPCQAAVHQLQSTFRALVGHAAAHMAVSAEAFGSVYAWFTYTRMHRCGKAALHIRDVF